MTPGGLEEAKCLPDMQVNLFVLPGAAAQVRTKETSHQYHRAPIITNWFPYDGINAAQGDQGTKPVTLPSYEPEQRWSLHRDKIVGCSCSTGVFELQISQRLILPTCWSGACKTARSFLGNNCIFCLWYETFQDWKTPKTSNKRGKFSLSCSIQSTGQANKIHTTVWDETYQRKERRTMYIKVLSPASHLPLIKECEVTVLQAKVRWKKLRI